MRGVPQGVVETLLRRGARKQELLTRAVGNLVKKANFLILAQEDPGHIYTRVQKNPKRYTIEMSHRVHQEDFDIIDEIFRTIGKEPTEDLSTLDVEEMFGYRPHSLSDMVSTLERKNKRKG